MNWVGGVGGWKQLCGSIHFNPSRGARGRGKGGSGGAAARRHGERSATSPALPLARRLVPLARRRVNRVGTSHATRCGRALFVTVVRFVLCE